MSCHLKCSYQERERDEILFELKLIRFRTSKMNIFVTFSLLLLSSLLLLVATADSHDVFEAVPAELAMSNQKFLREPLDQIASIGEHVTLPCRVVNKLGALQWTRDDFGLGTDRNLTGYKRYRMTGSDEEGKTDRITHLEGVRHGEVV